VIATGTLDASTARPPTPASSVSSLNPHGPDQHQPRRPIIGWNNNTTYVYTGQFFDADGKFTFAENIDDNTSSRSTASPDSSATLAPTLPDRHRHLLHVRPARHDDRHPDRHRPAPRATATTAGNVGGAPATDFGMGPTTTAGTRSRSADQRRRWRRSRCRQRLLQQLRPRPQHLRHDRPRRLGLHPPIDPGDGSLFRTAVGGSGNIQVDAGATLAVGSINQIGTVTLNSDGTNGGTLQLTDKAVTTNSDFTGIVLGGSTGNLIGRLTLGTNNVVAASNLTLPPVGGAILSSKLIVDSTGTPGTLGQFNVGSPNVQTGSTLQVDGARVNVTGSGFGNGSYVVNNTGTLRVDGSVASASSVTVNNSGKFEAGSTQTVKQLNLNDTAVAQIVTGALKVLTVGDRHTAMPLVVARPPRSTSRTNGLVVDYSAGNETTAIQTVRGQVISAYNGGNWQARASPPPTPDTSHYVGYAQASEAAPTGTFMGKTGIDSDSILVRYTLAGDATLDGTVDFNDLVHLAQNYNTTVSATTDSWWYNGDFTYDGVVDFNDLVKLAQNYNTALPSEPVPGASISFNADLAAASAPFPSRFAQPARPGGSGPAPPAQRAMRRSPPEAAR
jgi:hypothetical protein